VTGGPTGLVLAAGTGSRLASIGASKPLVPVCGRPLIHHVIESLRDAGIVSVTLVLGHRAAQMQAALDDFDPGIPLSTLFNPEFLKPNGWSALAAKGHVAAPFVLSMSDHIYEPLLVRRLLARPLALGEARLAVDKRRDNPLVDMDDVTRVLEEDGHISDIGKGIAAWNAFDTGVFYAGESLFAALAEDAQAGSEVSLSAAMRRLAKKGLATTADIGDAFWIDVDDPAALARAEAAMPGRLAS